MWFHAFRNSFMILNLKKLAMQYLPDTARDMYIDLPAIESGKSEDSNSVDVLVCLLVCVFSCACCANGATLFHVCLIIVSD